MVICLTILTSSSHSQTTTIDATLVPNAKLRDAAKLIEKGKICELRVEILNEKIDILNQRIAAKDSIIMLHDQKDTTQLAQVKTYKAEVDNLVQQRDIAVKEVMQQNRLLKKQKRKTIIAVAGTAAIGIAAIIFLK